MHDKKLPSVRTLLGVLFAAALLTPAGAQNGEPATTAPEPIVRPQTSLGMIAIPDASTATVVMSEAEFTTPAEPVWVEPPRSVDESATPTEYVDQHYLDTLKQHERALAPEETEPAEWVHEELPPPLPEPTTGSTIAGYFVDRALDLADFFRFRFHAPRGFRSVGFKVRGTALAQVGFIFFDGKSIGLDRRGVGIWRERRLEGGVSLLYFSKVHDEMIAGNRFTDVNDPWSRLHQRGIVRNGRFWDDGRLHPLSIGAEIQLFFFGTEFEVYPLEILDAPLGWFLLDSPQDDDSRIQRRWREIQASPELHVRSEWYNTFEHEPPGGEEPPLRPTGEPTDLTTQPGDHMTTPALEPGDESTTPPLESQDETTTEPLIYM
jgi:hypothetical protein